MYRISIDPGLEGTGLAIWSSYGTENDWRTMEPPTKVMNDIRSMHYTWEYRLIDICKQIDFEYAKICARGAVTHTYIEWPHYRTDPVGQTATARGDIYKLSALIGAIMQVASGKYDSMIGLIPVLDWKGQLPKPVVAKRCMELIDYKRHEKLAITSHGWDAVGIGLYAKGHRFST